ncbi:peptide MFS transporter [Enterococcus faecalis]|uniref:peptide MFS transporter n=1 Tax=Enterococcus faecalis TaxID=1351 RepID=UPI003D0C15AE
MDKKKQGKAIFFDQPKGLSTLFFTEVWERFSYYGMRAILIYYIYDSISNGGLGFSKEDSLAIMSIYGSMVFMSSVLGGWVADRLFGLKKTVFVGGLLILLGHLVLSMPYGTLALFVSLTLIILGTGLLKPNISGMVGKLYSGDDAKRDIGFSIFCMGINIGGLIAPLIVGTIGQKYNYHAGFSIAAIGMVFGLFQYSNQRHKKLRKIGDTPTNPLSKNEQKKIKRYTFVVLTILVISIVLALKLNFKLGFLVNMISAIGIALPIYYFARMLTSKKVTKIEKKGLIAYIPLFLASVVFCSLEEQGASTLAIFASERVNNTLFGIHIATSWFQSLNPVFVVILTPVFVALWTKLGNHQPSTVVKFSLGLVFAGVSFILLMLPAIIYGNTVRVSSLWLISSFFLVVIGEMCIIPVGLSVTTRLAPKAFESQTMAIWFLSNAGAQALNAQVVKFYTTNNESFYFGAIGAIGIGFGVVLFLLKNKIKCLMKNS